MTQGPQGTQQTGMVAGLVGTDTEQDTPTGDAGPVVGADDAAADAAAGGADVDLSGAQRDTDGVPVGEADAAADRAR